MQYSRGLMSYGYGLAMTHKAIASEGHHNSINSFFCNSSMTFSFILFDCGIYAELGTESYNDFQTSRDAFQGQENSSTSIGEIPQRFLTSSLEVFGATLLTSDQGQHGRVAVLGGSEDYTGAPYFSAMASAKLGCDMVF
jgi:Carbohydrate kinase